MMRFWQVWLLVPALAWGWGDAIAKQNRTNIVALQQRIQAQQERIDGLVSVIEGLNETVGRLQGRLHALRQEKDDAILIRIETLEQQVKSLQDHFNKHQTQPEASTPKHARPKDADASSSRIEPSAAKRYAQAVLAYKKRAYGSAKRLFSQLVEEDYKRAASYFYLGEIAYYTKDYDHAIYYYKQSANANDKAGYMDVLLLHTAVSLEKTGKKLQAKTFYQSVIENYRGRKSAAIAKKRFKRLAI